MVPNIVDTIGLDEEEYEVIVINSGGTETRGLRELPMVSIHDSPTRLGAPQARNLGAEKSSGGNIVFADAHLKFEENWGPQVLETLRDNEDGLIAPTFSPMNNSRIRLCGCTWKNGVMGWRWIPWTVGFTHEIPFAGAGFVAVRRRTFDLVGRWDSGIKLWGGEDYDLSIRAWLLGYRVLCNPSIVVRHLFRKTQPYEMEWTDISYNKIRIAFSHFAPKRLKRFLDDYHALFSDGDKGRFAELLLLNIEDKVLDRRAKLFKERKFSDDWFFERFAMDGRTEKSSAPQ